MVSTASTLWYVDAADPAAVLREHRDPDPGAAQALAKQLFEDYEIVPKMIGTLAGCAGPDVDEVYIGCYPGLTVVCSRQVRLPDPTTLPQPLIRPLASEHTYLVSFDARMGWGSFAHWERGEFRRAFSSSRMKILADEGLPLVWERPFWAGERPVLWRADELPDPQCLPYDPPDFADEANHVWLGFQYRAPLVDGALLPRDIAVCGFTLVPKDPPPEALEPAPAPSAPEDRRPEQDAAAADRTARPKDRTPGARGHTRGLRGLDIGRQAQDPQDEARVAQERSPGSQERMPGQDGRVLARRGPAPELSPQDPTRGPCGQVPAAQRRALEPRGAQDGALGERDVLGEPGAGTGAQQRAFGQQGSATTQPPRRPEPHTAEPEAVPTATAAPVPQGTERRGLLGWLRGTSRPD